MLFSFVFVMKRKFSSRPSIVSREVLASIKNTQLCGRHGVYLKLDTVQLLMRGTFFSKESGLVLSQVEDKVEEDVVLGFGKLGEYWSRMKRNTMQLDVVSAEHWTLTKEMLPQ